MLLHYPFINLLLLAFAFLGGKKAINGDFFKHHFISTELPGDENWGYGVSLLSDLDKDGDLDFVTCVKLDSIYWFENKSNGTWDRHTLGKISKVQLGSAIMDVDNDGWPDVVSKIWKRWPGNANGGREHVSWLENLAK